MLSFPSIVFYSIFLSLPFFFVLAPQYRDFYTLPHLHRPPAISHSTTNLPKPKIAFLFLTNSNLSFTPLWEKFFHGNHHLFNIYIHSDPSLTITPPNGIFLNRFIPSIKTHRSSPTLISAARRLLAAALSDDPSNYFFALVSQHCIPLHSFNFTYNYLFNFNTPSPPPPPPPSFTASFMNWGSIKKQSLHKSFIEILSDEPNLFERYAARGFHVMLPDVPFEEFKVGSQFFVLKRRHAEIVVEDRRMWGKFKLPCASEEPCYPEEHYFPTLLSMEDRDGCTGFTLTRVNWTGCWDGHPHRYTPPEVSPELLRRLRESNSSYSYLFARKFSPECLPELMDLADDVIFRD